MRRQLGILGILCCLLIPFNLMGTTTADALHSAHTAYSQGRYSDAISVYEQARKSAPHHVDLLYNLGTAYLRDGQIGPAVLNLEKARRLHPRDPQILAHLQDARRQVILPPGPVPDSLAAWLMSCLSRLSLTELGMAFSTICLLWSISFAVHARTPSRGTTGTMLIAGVGCVILGILTGLKSLDERFPPTGVVIPNKLAIRSAPTPSLDPMLHLHGGVVVRVLARHDGWAKVRTRSGLAGWVTGDGVNTL